jgi:hypothetical protein
MKRVLILFLVSITSLTFAQNSILFDASDQQYLTISNADDRFNATADFTYEIWVKFTSKGFNGQRLAPFFGGHESDYAALIDNKIGMRLNSNGVCSGDRTFGNTSTIDTDTWYHIAYVRSGSVVSLYLDGTLLGTTECSQEDGSVKGVWMINANTINIGAIFWNTSYLDGYIGGMRYVVGTALYSEDFTPQLRWEKTNETILLMNIKNEGAAFTDESDYSNTINLNGSSSSPTFVAGNGPTLPADILLSGNVSIENNSIKNVADPVYAQDAATKSYVDSNVNSFSGSYSDLTDTPTSSLAFQLPMLTTAQRDEIVASLGMMIYNVDVNEFQGFQNYEKQFPAEIDQQHLTINNGGGENRAQSFTSSATGELTLVKLPLSVMMESISLSFKIIEGEGVNGTVLFETSYYLTNSNQEWIEFGISGVDVISGNLYTIQLTEENSGCGMPPCYTWGMDTSGNNYSGGQFFYNGTPYSNGEYDSAFITYVSLKEFVNEWITLH